MKLVGFAEVSRVEALEVAAAGLARIASARQKEDEDYIQKMLELHAPRPLRWWQFSKPLVLSSKEEVIAFLDERCEGELFGWRSEKHWAREEALNGILALATTSSTESILLSDVAVAHYLRARWAV